MAKIKAFSCIRPKKELADKIAALPYDVYTREEAKKVVAANPLSFLGIDRAETSFPDEVDTYDDRVYQKAHDLLWDAVEKGQYETDDIPAFYIYELTMDGRSQTGIAACASVDDYLNNVIKKHENTRADKEVDRIRHVGTCGAQTGPIFLAYRGQQEIDRIVAEAKQQEPLYSFISDDQVKHQVWAAADPKTVKQIEQAFAGVENLYIADGHHRAASAVKVGLKRREENKDYDGTEEFNYFLSVLFPHEQLKIMDYNRLVKDLNGLSEEEFLNEIAKTYQVTKAETCPLRPAKKGQVGMCLQGRWYRLDQKKAGYGDRVVDNLDVAVLQHEVLDKVLGIQDPKTDNRITFVGGIVGLEELERQTAGDYAVGFAMYPTSMEELLDVADAGDLMPPKSTWFEPKLRSGLFIHSIK